MSSSYTPISTAASTSTAGPVNLDFVSRAKHRVYSTLATRRPWRQFFNFRALSLPRGIADAFTRLRGNLGYFRVNFAMFALLVLFLSLLWHPISLIVFVVMMAAWLFLYFLRDEPLAFLGRTIDDRIVLAVLTVLTLLFLFLTSATVNILVALAVSVAVIFLYSVFRRTDDLFVDEEAAVAGGLVGRPTGG